MTINLDKGVNVLAPFDGMACGMIALKELGIKVNRYIAYEIDKYAIKTSSYNFPEIEHKGDVFTGDFKEYEDFDFLMGGSPCTHWSVAQTKNRETTASGIGWDLFSQYVRALNESKPKCFIYENNKSMSDAIRQSITETFGFEPICINSALLSAQNRQRLYWVGIRQEDGTYKKCNVEQPEDLGILLKDILETGTTWMNKSHTIDATYYKATNGTVPFTGHQSATRMMAAEIIQLSDNEINYMVRSLKDGRNHFDFCYFQDANKDKSHCITANISKGVPYNVIAEPLSAMGYNLESVAPNKEDGIIAMLDMPGQHEILRRVYGENGKSPTLNTCQGGNRQPKVFTELKDGITIKGKNFTVYEVKDGMIYVNDNSYPIKLKDGLYIIRKLTVNECKRLQTIPEWYEFPVSNSQAYKMIGNGWTINVIKHLIKSIIEEM